MKAFKLSVKNVFYCWEDHNWKLFLKQLLCTGDTGELEKGRKPVLAQKKHNAGVGS